MIVLNPQIAVREATCMGLVCRSHNWPADKFRQSDWSAVALVAKLMVAGALGSRNKGGVDGMLSAGAN